MDIKKFLELTQKEAIYFFDTNCPKSIKYIYDYYFDIKAIFTKEYAQDFPQLILFQDPTMRYQSRLVQFSNKNYVLISLTQLAVISQFMELLFFKKIDYQSHTSFFHQNLINYNIGFIDLKALNKNNEFITYRFEPNDRKDLLKSKEYIDKVNSNAFAKTFSERNGFENIFEFYVIYLIVHEFSHFLNKNINFKFIDYSEKIINNNRRCFLGSELIQILNNTNFSNRLIEEIVCDSYAVEVAIKYTESLGDYHKIFYLLFSSIFYSSLLFMGINTKIDTIVSEELYIRKMISIRNIYDFLGFDKDIMFEPYDRNNFKFKRICEFIDLLCIAVLNYFMKKQNLKKELEKYIKSPWFKVNSNTSMMEIINYSQKELIYLLNS